ncbi:uncharacterized protein KQ657_003256 [Scheffersomyces spartinae]|uniref:Aminodeoxychorismate lyase n=1 Tax=Scheffersomyces spartinae TaxID=45513 RepID=A0A9P7VCC2_9ASCO|nr:uncharacterized protein KQ657_003256 [Scheffersomyces spartinae]KAG7195493.1 hypothetical protein KQ657_003256 [Scheffersomyces spartinae]
MSGKTVDTTDQDKEQYYKELIETVRKEKLSDIYEVGPNDFQLLSTIRYDPGLSSKPPLTVEDITKKNFFLFKEHVERLIYSLGMMRSLYKDTHPLPKIDISEAFIYERLIEGMTLGQVPVGESLKIRFLLGLDGNAKIEFYPTPSRLDLYDGYYQDVTSATAIDESEIWDVYIDTQETAISPFTSFKTTHRNVYNSARTRMLPGRRPGKEEVILKNTFKMALEGSISNFAIKRESDGKWITPRLKSGCLCGVMRNKLLSKRYIYADNIYWKELKIGQEVLLFNGIMGVVRGRIVG